MSSVPGKTSGRSATLSPWVCWALARDCHRAKHALTIASIVVFFDNEKGNRKMTTTEAPTTITVPLDIPEQRVRDHMRALGGRQRLLVLLR